MNPDRIQNVFFFSMLLLGLIFFLYLLYPFLGALALAITLAIIFKPLYHDILRSVKKPAVASIITVILVTIIVAIPVGFLATNVFGEIQQLYYSYLTPSAGATMPSFGNLPGLLQGMQTKYLPWLVINFDSLRTQLVGWLFGGLSNLFGSFFKLIFDFFIIIMGMFYLFKDGHILRKKLAELSPLKDTDDRLIMSKIEGTINSVIRGSVLIGALQGLLVGIGFALFSVPQPILWGTVASVAALVPSIGTALITIPAVIFLLATGQYLLAIGLVIWSLALVHSIDGILGPILMGRGMKVHPFFIFLAVIGGLGFFGPIGFIIGPIVLSLSFTLLEIYASLKSVDK